MNKYINVMRQAKGLSDTCLESLKHIKSKFNQGEFESTMMMFHDSANAFYQMQKSIQTVLKELPDNELELLSDSLRDTIELVVSTYEQEDRGKVLEILQFTLLPQYKKWQDELNRCFQPYLLS